jgi:surfeit locus 1 family protein
VSRIRFRDWAFLILILLVAAICVRLAFWQIARLNERRKENANIQDQLALPLLELPSLGMSLDEIAYRNVIVQGTFDAEREILLKNRSYTGQAGYHLVTPLRIEGSEEAVLVDRGWIPIDSADDKRRRYVVDGLLNVVGIARLSQPEPGSFLGDPIPGPDDPPLKAWRLLNIEGIQKQIPYPLLSFFIQQTEPPKETTWAPIPVNEIDLSEGPHLGYTIQWFSFAIIAILGGAFWFNRKRKLILMDAEGEDI